ncbi:MAG: hypothetical protein ACXWV5_00780 [Flavitalea sp.]
MKKLVAVFAILIGSFQVIAQNATGSWYGRADITNMGANQSNYLTELIIKQKGDEVEGIFGYYFKDSYQSFFVRGTYNKTTREVSIKNLPVLFYGAATRNGIECPMHFYGTLMVSKAGSTLNGALFADNKYKYTCPELRVSYKIDDTENTDSSLAGSSIGKKYWKPEAEDFIVSGIDNNIQRSNTISTDSISSMQSNKNRLDEENLVKRFIARKNSYSKDIEVESDSIRISFYDNGDIDGDTISVFLNNQPVMVQQALTSRSMNLFLTIDTTREINELSMFAENLGKFPPNTALMVVTDGVNRYELYLSSSLTSNAAVRIRRKK